MPSSDSSREALLEQLAEEFVQRHRRGERPALSEYAEQHPDLADEIRDLFPALVQIEHLKPVAADLTGAFVSENSPAAGHSPERLGEYRILRQVGYGGMGVVYEAEQETLGRHVALKVLPRQALLKTTYLERFRREAKAAGKLHHTNIVPVFGVGECDGTYYYAMQFIHGEGLDKVLRDLRRLRAEPAAPTTAEASDASVAHSLLTGRFLVSPEALPSSPGSSIVTTTDGSHGSSALSAGGAEADYHRGVARVAVQVADALAYAHRQGILHRDIKPSNLLLDQQGTVWITDFGLAKAEGADDLTQTGDIVGTIRFMAPERFDGRSLPQSDVYALGVTLYELLTLRPAFDDANKGRLVNKVLHEPPVPPRNLDPRIPRDLETVVLKCLAKDPAERYTSAQALAEDVRRFLADRPILARRSTWWERTWRWARRNPGWAAMLVSVALMLTIIAVGGVVMSVSLNDALGQVQQERDEGKRKLFASYVSEADAKRLSRRLGQRFGSLKSIRNALDVARDIGLLDEDRVRLRTIAVAALCLPDIEPGLEWPAGPDKPLPEGLDPLVLGRVRAQYALSSIPEPAHGLRGPTWHSPDGRFVAVATRPYGAGTGLSVPARVWRVDGPTPVLLLEDPEGPYEQATDFRADGGQVAFGHADGSVSIFDTQTRKEIRRLERGSGTVFCLAFHPTLPRLAVSNGSDVTIWDLETFQRRSVLRHPTTLSAVAWHPRGHRLVTASDRDIHLWDVEAAKRLTEPWLGQGGGIQLCFDATGDRVISSDWGGTLRLWDGTSGQLLLSMPGGGFPLSSTDGQALGPRWHNDKGDLLRLAGGQDLRTLRRPTPRGFERLLNFAMHPGGRLLAATTQTGLAFFDLMTGEEVGFVAGNFDRSLRFDMTGALWTVGGAGLVRWPTSTTDAAASCLRLGPPEWMCDVLLNGHDGFDISADGRVAIVPLYQGAAVIHRGPPRRVLRLGPQYDVRHVQLSPDGHWALTGSHFHDETDAWQKVWDADTGQLVSNLPTEMNWTNFHGFSSDSRWIYVGGKETRKFEIASLRMQPIHRDAPASAKPVWELWRSEPIRLGRVYSPDKRIAAMTGSEGGVLLVTAEDEKDIALLPSPEVAPISPSAFTPDGTRLLTYSGETGTLYAFDLRRLRSGLATLGLDWDAPSFAPLGPLESDVALPPRLHLELVRPEAATSAANMAQLDAEQAVVALCFDPFDPDAHYRVGLRLMESGRTEDSYAHLTAALICPPGCDVALYSRAVAAFRMRRWDDAAADATRCLKTYAHEGKALLLRARACMALKRHEQAAADLTALIAKYPYSAEYFRYRAECYQALGKPDLAATDQQKARRAAPHDAINLNNRAWLLVTGPVGTRDPQRALELICEAIAHRPDAAVVLNTLGVVQFRNGLYSQARESLERSLANGQGAYDAYDLFFLAMCHAKLGDSAKARGCFDRAVGWMAKKEGLQPREIEELKMFRAEAEAELRGP
jgi:serine/threonine protein kinase/WD40 repeat protein/tetratricopeptide (TPR) repeat protein